MYVRMNGRLVQDGKGVTPLLAVSAAGRLKLAKEVLALCKELDVRWVRGTYVYMCRADMGGRAGLAGLAVQPDYPNYPLPKKT